MFVCMCVCMYLCMCLCNMKYVCVNVRGMYVRMYVCVYVYV